MVTISDRADEAPRRRGPEPGQRIRQLPILPDIVEWIREGYPAAEVARRIHANGFLEDVAHDLLRQEISRYAKAALAPAEVMNPTQMSAMQVRAAGALETALGELVELGELYRVEKALLCEATGVAPSPGTVGAEELRDAPQVALPSPGEGGLDGDTEPTQAGTTNPGVRPKTFRDVRELMGEMRQTLRVHGGLRERLGGLGGGPEEQRATLEERLAGVVKGRFAGRQDVQEALLDPRRRTKVLGVLHRFLTSQRSQDAAAASLAGELVAFSDDEPE